VVTMLERSMGTNLIWMANRQLLSNLLLLNGPSANPSYVFMPSAREGMPNTLFGYPLIFNEHCPVLGTTGDIILADWRYYLIGDRQATTVDSSKHYQFQNDITSWRAVHRVDGQPWLDAPITQSDGSTQISPFVVLSGVVGS
jgi:HK97 family phage major capsid protein